MKTIVAATSAVALLLVSGTAAAQGVELFGEAFLGLGYNIDNDGGVLFDDEGQTPDTVRAISQVRFGVEMTGETESGIVFGAEIWADDAEEGEGGQVGQVEGSVFVSGRLGYPDLRRHRCRRSAVGRRRPRQLFVDRADRHQRHQVHLERRQLRRRQRRDLRREPVRSADGALRFRPRGVWHLGLDEPRPHRHRRRRRVFGRPRRG